MLALAIISTVLIAIDFLVGIVYGITNFFAIVEIVLLLITIWCMYKKLKNAEECAEALRNKNSELKTTYDFEREKHYEE